MSKVDAWKLAWNQGNQTHLTLLLYKCLDMFNEYSSLLLIKRCCIILIQIDLLICPMKHPRRHPERPFCSQVKWQQNMLWYSCLIKHAKTLLRTKDCCTYSLQHDVLTHQLLIAFRGIGGYCLLGCYTV
jgi:hypothetical protein